MIHASRLVPAVLIATLGLVIFAPAGAAAASPQQNTVNAMAGTWTCVTHSSDNKTYRETDVDTLYGNWLRIDASYAAQNGQPASTSVTFLGYDSAHKRWVVSAVGTDGSYFTSTSSSPTFDGSAWTDAYPVDGGTATIHMTPYTQYTLDVQSPDPQGKMMTAQSICTKQ